MSSDPRSDEDLIVAIQQRDVRALEQLYDRHRVLAYSLALRMLGNSGDAEDVLQEAFINVWRAAGSYRAERVHHRSIDKLRGRQSRFQPASLEEGMDAADDTDVWRQVAQNLTGEDVRRALDFLPVEQRETIELAYFRGYTHTQISEMMAVPLGTVKGRMRIGLQKLKSLLEGSQTGLAVD
jgi:RNA polymerase sigma-70 factor (ECF subfamily)